MVQSRGQQLRLAVIRVFQEVFLNSATDDEETDDHEERTTVWVHNDNATLLGHQFNYYSGITVTKSRCISGPRFLTASARWYINSYLTSNR